MARYDGHADWYEAQQGPADRTHLEPLRRLLGNGTGPCLDLGCGTGTHAELIKDSGRVPIGADLSGDQLRHAAPRFAGRVVRADAHRLPFADASFPTVLAAWVSTDLDDFAAVLREAARVLAPDGVLISYGVHPCFNGPHVQTVDQVRIIHDSYRRSGWHTSAPWWGEGGIRSRFGMRHLTLADFWNAFLGSGLAVEHVVEPDRGDRVPYVLGLRARRPAERPQRYRPRDLGRRWVTWSPLNG